MLLRVHLESTTSQIDQFLKWTTAATVFHVHQFDFLEPFIVSKDERLVVANLVSHRPLVPSANPKNTKTVLFGLRADNMILKEHFVD